MDEIENQDRWTAVEKVSIGVAGVGVGILIGAFAMFPHSKKLFTMAKLSSELMKWAVANGVRMPTEELDTELYEKLSFIGLAARGMK
jgi:hypothetical protein